MLAAFATYGTALLVRPIGALLFGRMADARGPRAVMVPVILIMAGATAAVGLLPSWLLGPARESSTRSRRYGLTTGWP
jgi:MFS family permease